MAEKRRILTVVRQVLNIHRYAISLSNCPKLSDEPRITLLRPAQLRRAGKRLSTPLPKSNPCIKRKETTYLFVNSLLT